MPFTKICLGTKIDQRQRFIPVENSLYSLIADGKYWRTSLGRNTWKSLIGTQASLQRKCNKEGFNVVTSVAHSKARIGVIANEQTNWNSCDSRTGFGTEGFPDDSNTCGNIAQDRLRAVNGNKRIKAVGYYLIQWWIVVIIWKKCFWCVCFFFIFYVRVTQKLSTFSKRTVTIEIFHGI